MGKNNASRAGAVVAVVAAGLAVWSGLAQATDTDPQLKRTEESNVRVEDHIRINAPKGAQVITSHITVKPGAAAPWHYHPGPHLVSVRTGTVVIYETDCTFRTYPAGTGFFDPGPTRRPHIHYLKNPSPTEPAEIVITDVRTGDDLRPTVVADPQPAPCPS